MTLSMLVCIRKYCNDDFFHKIMAGNERVFRNLFNIYSKFNANISTRSTRQALPKTKLVAKQTYTPTAAKTNPYLKAFDTHVSAHIQV